MTKDESIYLNIDYKLSADISENEILRKIPEILNILLVDRTASTKKKTKNIIWANDNYVQYGPKAYSEKSEMLPELITGHEKNIIKPRAVKNKIIQHKRTNAKAEVFTPTWMVRKQNDTIDKAYQNDDINTYVQRKWLEITAGEGPYMATRYDMETGNIVPLKDRAGFIDRKLKRINCEVNDLDEWNKLVEKAYQSSYGFEWNGDSLFIARENLLYTYRDYFVDKWDKEPPYKDFKNIATIISYNLFQMDGIKYIIPLSEKKKDEIFEQTSLFGDDEVNKVIKFIPGKKVKIMNWDTHKMEYFNRKEI